MKTPEEYMKDISPPGEADKSGNFTSAEKAFLSKYLGVDAGGASEAVSSIKRVDPRGEDNVPGFGPRPGAGSKEDFVDYEERFKDGTEPQLVSFLLCDREFALPIMVIQEVIKWMPPTVIPKAPPFLEGVVNLRGRVTPLLNLRKILCTESVGREKDKFIVVCRHKGLQLGLMIHAVATMYRPDKTDLEWNVEAQVGVAAQYLLGLMKKNEKLVSILSIDRLVQNVLRT